MSEKDVVVYDLKEVASVLNVSYRTVQNYVYTGMLKAVKRGRKWFVTKEHLQEFVNSDNK